MNNSISCDAVNQRFTTSYLLVTKAPAYCDFKTLFVLCALYKRIITFI